MKNALITGGAKRLGKNISLWLAQNDFNVCVTYNTSGKNVAQLQNNIENNDKKFLAIKADLNNIKSYDNIFNKYNAKFDKLDLLIHNAAIFPQNDLLSISNKNWDKAFNINLKSIFFISKLFSRIMNEGSNVLIISSLGGLEIWKNRLLYNVTKSAQITLTKCLARELAPKIRVNSIAPSTVLMDDEDKLNSLIHKDKLPLKRHSSLDDIYTTIEFLLKNKSMTGSIIPVDNGKLLI